MLPSKERLLAVLLHPKLTWPVIAREPDTVARLYTGWVLWLAAIPPIFGALGIALFFRQWPMLQAFMPGYSMAGLALRTLVLGYVVEVVMVAILAWLVQVLAPSFGGRADPLQATKTVAYALTPVWVAGVFQLAFGVPLVALIGLLAGGYAIYQTYLALPQTMACAPDKAVIYVLVVVLPGFVIQALLWRIVVGI